MTTRITFKSAVPPTPAEAAAAAATWERRGLLGRLVRLDDEAAPAHGKQRPARRLAVTSPRG